MVIKTYSAPFVAAPTALMSRSSFSHDAATKDDQTLIHQLESFAGRHTIGDLNASLEGALRTVGFCKRAGHEHDGKLDWFPILPSGERLHAARLNRTPASLVVGQY